MKTLRGQDQFFEKANLLITVSYFTLLILALGGCGKQASSSGTGNNLIVQSAPLAGPNAASVFQVGPMRYALLFWQETLGESLAHAAAISAFTAFRACNDTLVFIDGNGNTLNVNGSQNPQVGRGLLSFSPTGTSPSQIGTLNLPAGTTLSEVDITFAVVPSVCSGASYAVEFDPGTGPIDITQNTAFKFKYSSPVTVSGNSQTITLMFGSIVNAMVAKGAGLSNSSIQSISVGQAQ